MTQNDTPEIIQTFKVLLADPVSTFMDMTVICKLTAFVALVCLAIAVVTAVISRLSNAPRSGFLATVGMIGLVSGLLGAAYGGFTTYVAVQAMHVTRLVVYLPSLIEVGVCAGIGLLAWLVAQMGNAGAKRR